MIRNFTRQLFVAAPIIALLSACGGGAGGDGESSGAGDAPPEIAERQGNFEAIGDAFKAIRTQLDADSPDLAAIATSAGDINERAGKITGLFPEATGVDDGYDTEALATIWELPAEFEKAASDLVAASAALKAAAESGDTGATGEAAGAMGGTCKACHDKFRVKKD